MSKLWVLENWLILEFSLSISSMLPGDFTDARQNGPINRKTYIWSSFLHSNEIYFNKKRMSFQIFRLQGKQKSILLFYAFYAKTFATKVTFLVIFGWKIQMLAKLAIQKEEKIKLKSWGAISTVFGTKIQYLPIEKEFFFSPWKFKLEDFDVFHAYVVVCTFVKNEGKPFLRVDISLCGFFARNMISAKIEDENCKQNY